MKKFIHYFWISLVFCSFFLSLYVLLSHNNPVLNMYNSWQGTMNPKILTLNTQITKTTWDDKNQTLQSPEGNFKIDDISQSEGTFMGSDGDSENKKVIVISMTYTNTTNHDIRPHDIYPNIIEVDQDSHELTEGMLKLKERGGSAFNDTANNAVKFYSPGKSGQVVAAYGFDDTAGPLTIRFGKHTETKQINQLQTK